MSMDWGKALGESMRVLRRERGLSQEGLAKRCHTTQAYVSYLEAGRCSPTLAMLGAIAASFGITLSSFVRVMEGQMRISSEKSFTEKKENDSQMVNDTL